MGIPRKKSRRVEFKFRLIDMELLQEMEKELKTLGNNGSRP